MSYDLVKAGIADLLESLGYQESDQVIDFENATEHEYNKKFILTAEAGIMADETSETIVDRFYDTQAWSVKIAFEKSQNTDVISRDDLHRKKDLLLNKLDKPANWTSFVRILKYNSWNVEAFSNYFVLEINLQIVDTYIYT